MQDIQWHQLNWGGIGFVFLMVIFLPACAGVIHLIRRSGNGTLKIRRVKLHLAPEFRENVLRHVDFKYASLPATLPSLAEQHYRWLPSDEAKLEGMMRNAPLRLVPPAHEHTIDLERSRMVVIEGGVILAHCCISGCTAVVRLGRNIALLVIEHPEASHANH